MPPSPRTLAPRKAHVNIHQSIAAVPALDVEDLDLLEAEGLECVGRGYMKLAQAKRLRAVRRDAPADEIVPVSRFAEFGFATERVFADAMRDGRIVSFRAGNKRCAYRRDILAHLETRRAAPKLVELDADSSDDDDYRRTAGAAE